MKTTLNTSEAASLLMADENADWTRAGAYALIEHLEQLEEDCGITEFEFDRVALRCDYSEDTLSLQLIGRGVTYYGSDQLAGLPWH